MDFIDNASIDADHSVDPYGFAMMVDHVREAVALRGDGEKKPLPGEMHDRYWARRAECDWLRPTLEARKGIWQEDCLKDRSYLGL